VANKVTKVNKVDKVDNKVTVVKLARASKPAHSLDKASKVTGAQVWARAANKAVKASKAVVPE
jgi:hypothetical protein